jgi:hypothetical protein
MANINAEITDNIVDICLMASCGPNPPKATSAPTVSTNPIPATIAHQPTTAQRSRCRSFLKM